MDNQNKDNLINQYQELLEDNKIPDRRWPKKIIIFAGLLMLAVILLAENLINIQNEKSGQLKENAGLFKRFANSSNIGDLVIDQNYIWVANGQGLIRYNKNSGQQKIFTETDGLLGNETTGIIKYGDEIWVTSQSRGISILNTKDSSWRYFTTANGLVNDGNLVLKLDGDVAWLATFDGFAKYDFTTGKWTSWKEGDGIKFAGVSDFAFDDKKVWINVTQNAYTRGGVIELDKKTLIWRDLIKNNPIISKDEYWAHYKLNLLDQILYIPSSKNLYALNTVNGEWKIFNENSLEQSIPITSVIKHDNNYWYFKEDNNIAVSNSLSAEPVIIKTNLLSHYCPKIAHSFNYSGIEDGYSKEFNFDGNTVWFGCRQGFAAYNLKSNSWAFKETKSNYPAEIYNILAAKNGALLVDSSLGLGLATPDYQKWVFIKSLEASDSLWGSAVWADDNIYFVEILEAFGMGGPSEPPRLWKYNLPSRLVNQVRIPESLSLGELLDLKINKNLWFNSGSEIQEFNPTSREVASYKPEIGPGKYLIIKDIKKKDNNLWFVSNLGLGNFDLISKKFKIVGNPVSIKLPDWGLDHLVVLDNQVWASASGDQGKGLYVYGLDSETWEHLTQLNSPLRFNRILNLTGTSNFLLMPSSGRVDFSQRKRGDVSVITTTYTYIYEQHGLNVYDVVNNNWKFLTSEDGMLDGEIKNMHFDGSSVWFVNGSNGIWKLNFNQIK